MHFSKKTFRLSIIALYISLLTPFGIKAQSKLLIPMDNAQAEHLKAYGAAYFSLAVGRDVDWLLNYRGGSFALEAIQGLEEELLLRGVTYQRISGAQYTAILQQVTSESSNMDAVKLEKAPTIAVYSPKSNQPWDDAVTLVLTYAEIPYDIIYDPDVLDGKLKNYDWLHLHHEDFTGQYGKFYANYHNQPWYREQVDENERIARQYGFDKVSKLKLAVAEGIRDFVYNGGFLFAMCSATDSYDIALAAHQTDICAEIYDGDPMHPQCQNHLDFGRTFAFQDFQLELNPYVYEYSDIDMTNKRQVRPEEDFFTLFEFSAKWDPVPTMLTQNHTHIIKGFMGQTTSFDKRMIKPEVTIMGELKSSNEARYIHGNLGKGMWTFYGGHDPEDYQHFVGEEPTNLTLHKNSPGYRLILNNILFPAARKKKQKT
jgi:hypothetical protein